MRQRWFRITMAIVAVGVIGLVIYLHRDSNNLPSEQKSSPGVEPKSEIQQKPSARPTTGLVTPVTEFRQRITKKRFGTFVSPQHSPVQPERFHGYHTGVDVEYNDVKTVVAVCAITKGVVVTSQWLPGYGGVVMIRHQILGKPRLALYGHLKPSSMLAVGKTVARGQRVGILGKAYSSETDNERRHLHFSVLRNARMDTRGYVQSKAELSGWLNPLSLY